MNKDSSSYVSNKLGVAAIIASIAIPLTNIFAPIIGNWYNMRCQTEINKEIEFYKRKVDLTRILFDNYFNKKPDEQILVINYLMQMFPYEFIDQNINRILISKAANSTIQNNIKSNTNVLKNVVPKTYEDTPSYKNRVNIEETPPLMKVTPQRDGRFLLEPLSPKKPKSKEG